MENESRLSFSQSRPLDTRDGSAILSPLERAVLLTVLYSDLFEYPLSVDELQRYLVCLNAPQASPPAASPAALVSLNGDALDTVLTSLSAHYLSCVDGLICWKGREYLRAVRHERQDIVAQRWPQAQRYARWLSRVPFVRMVAVCGSQAAGNSSLSSDLDIFCITAPGRLWLVQSCAMLLRRIAALSGVHVCPNYFLTTRTLEIEEQSLYTAREVSHVIPLWGIETYTAFLQANGWITNFLPRWTPHDRLRLCAQTPPSRFSQRLERVFGTTLGDVCDVLIHRVLLVYYPLRLLGRGWDRQAFARWYRRDRQAVMTGGYAPVVAQQFRARVAERLGNAACGEDLNHLFPPTHTAHTPHAVGLSAFDELAQPDLVYSKLMHESYGQARDMPEEH